MPLRRYAIAMAHTDETSWQASGRLPYQSVCSFLGRAPEIIFSAIFTDNSAIALRADQFEIH